jgi:hypothetical protein
MEIYRRRYELNESFSQQDLWAFLTKKIANGGENSFKIP